jgi:hypothetical protein
MFSLIARLKCKLKQHSWGPWELWLQGRHAYTQRRVCQYCGEYEVRTGWD